MDTIVQVNDEIDEIDDLRPPQASYYVVAMLC